MFNIFNKVHSKYSKLCKMEIGIALNMFFEMLNSKYCLAAQKIDFLEGIARLFRTPSSIVNFYYNFDNRFHDFPLFERYINATAKIARGEALNILDSNDSDLQFSALTAMVNVLELLAKYIIRKSGFVKDQVDDLDSPNNDDLDFPSPTPTRKGFISEEKLSPTITGTSPTRKSFTDIYEGSRPRRASTWAKRFGDQRKLDEEFRKAVELSRSKSLKHAVKRLWGNKSVFVTPQDVAKWLKGSDGLDKAEIGDFLGSDFTSDFSSDFFNDLRSAYLQLFDFSSMAFDQAFRLFLINAGFRLPGEAQKIDRLLEAFAERYCQDNPTVFPTTESAFIMSFSLIMLNTDLHDPRLASGKRTKPPMSIDDFVRNLKGTNDGSLLSLDLLQSLYYSVKEAPIEWKQSDSKSEIDSPDIPLNEKVILTERGFLQDCDLFFSKALGRIRSETCYQRSFLSTSSYKIVQVMFETSWGHFLSAFTALVSKSKQVEIVAVCLDGLRYSLCISILLNMSKEMDAFGRLLAKITLAENFSGTSEELQRAYVKGQHLDQEWFVV